VGADGPGLPGVTLDRVDGTRLDFALESTAEELTSTGGW
jgi:hypothetical protein